MRKPALLFLFGFLVAAQAHAAQIPWQPDSVSFAVREQPLKDFLTEFFSDQGLSIVVSNAVRGTVNGNFTGPPGKVFDDVVKAFSLLPYYDGTVVYVYAGSEAANRTIAVPRPLVPRMLKTMREMGMLNGRHTARAVPNEGLIILSGGRRFIEQAEEMSRNLQVQVSTGPSVFKMFPLKYAWAQDISLNYGGKQVLVPGVASILRSLLGSPSGAGLYFDQSDRMLRPTVEKLRGRGLRSQGEDGQRIERETIITDESSYVGGSAPLAGGDQVRIEAERRLNAVIVRDSKDRMPYYEQLIAALDVEPQVIEIEATIVDINNDRMRDLGINWRWSNAGDEVLFGRGDTSDLRLKPGQDVTPAGRGFFVSTTIGDGGTFVSRINALATEGAAKIISRPQIVTLSNVEAIVEANRSFFVRVAGEFDVDLFNVNAGTTLRVTPHILKEEGQQSRFRLLVNVEDGSLSDAQVDQIPVVDRAAINTQALITEGESLLIGGLVREQTTNNVTKVPLLGDIPGVKYLFRYSNKRTTRIERLFLITPRLVSSQRIAEQAKQSLRDAPQMAPPSVPPPPRPQASSSEASERRRR